MERRERGSEAETREVTERVRQRGRKCKCEREERER